MEAKELFKVALSVANPEKLKELVKFNIPLASYVKTRWSNYLDLIKTLLPPQTLQELKNVNYEEVLEEIKMLRPDIYSILNTPEGLKWLKNQKLEDFL